MRSHADDGADAPGLAAAIEAASEIEALAQVRAAEPAEAAGLAPRIEQLAGLESEVA